jgi:hypothetical protein
MPSTTAYTIRPATDADDAALERVAALDSRRSLQGEILVAEKDGSVVAALSLTDRHVVADPFRHTADALVLLHARAASLDAVDGPARQRGRLRAAVRLVRTRSAEAA